MSNCWYATNDERFHIVSESSGVKSSLRRLFFYAEVFQDFKNLFPIMVAHVGKCLALRTLQFLRRFELSKSFLIAFLESQGVVLRIIGL